MYYLYSAGTAHDPAEPTQRLGNEGVEGSPHGHSQHKDNELAVALSLLLGFIFMLLVDKGASSHHHSSSAASSGGASLLSGGSDMESGPSSSNNIANRKVCTATLGLVVHAAADGIALGAAAASHHSDIEFIVFFAIMLHKAPTAFGLTSFLVREGSDFRKVNKMLLMFSAAAPIGAFVTYFILNLVSDYSQSYCFGAI